MALPPNIVVTGAGRGLGKAIALRLSKAGHPLVVADLREDWIRETARVIEESGRQATALHVDLRDSESVEAMANEAAALGPIGGLVNNAALADGVGGKKVYEIPVDDWDAVLGVNMRGTFLVTRALAPHLIESGGGAIVNIGSDAATNGSGKLAHYIASKGAISAFTRACATDLGEHQITVNTVSPGLTESESAAFVPQGRHDEYRTRRPLKRDQQPGDLVGMVSFLLSDEARYITGQEIIVNGGFVYR